MLPHDYMDDLESFYYVLGHAVFSRVPNGQAMKPYAASRLEAWQSADYEKARTSKFEFTAGDWKLARFIDVDYWGEAYKDLIKEFRAFLEPIVRRKSQINGDEDLDHSGRIEQLRELGNDISTHYDRLDAIFQKALDKLRTEEDTLPPLAPATFSANGSSNALNRGRTLKRGPVDLDDSGTSGRASKRHNGQQTSALTMQNSDSEDDMDFDV